MNILPFFLFFAIVLIPIRVLLTGEITYGFMLWNLLLALVPFWISRWAERRQWKGPERFQLLGVAVLWVLFLPNAPYLLTDFYHLTQKKDLSFLWYDIWMLFSYSLLGLFLFYESLRHAERIWIKHFKHGAVGFVGVVLLLCSYAIYLGRFLRFNSWNLFTDPLDLLQAMVAVFVSISFWQVMLPFFFFLSAGYLLFRTKKFEL